MSCVGNERPQATEVDWRSVPAFSFSTIFSPSLLCVFLVRNTHRETFGRMHKRYRERETHPRLARLAN